MCTCARARARARAHVCAYGVVVLVEVEEVGGRVVDQGLVVAEGNREGG